jgi:aspartyl-tRNA(Asn)/glutamyl-tRNA(Gln) amidotransferase subunit A
MPEPCDLTIHEARALLDARKLSAVELAKSVLARIARVEPKVKAYVTVTEDVALRQAEAADQRIAKGERGPLLGIPMQLKDNLITKGIRTTCSSRMLEHFVPPYNATVTERLLAAGAVLAGKGNMDEFAIHRELGVLSHAQPVGPGSCAGRLQRRPRGGGGGQRMSFLPRLRYRRQHPPACRLL